MSHRHRLAAASIGLAAVVLAGCGPKSGTAASGTPSTSALKAACNKLLALDHPSESTLVSNLNKVVTAAPLGSPIQKAAEKMIDDDFHGRDTSVDGDAVAAACQGVH